MLNFKKPALLFGLVSTILFFVGLYVQQKEGGGFSWLLYLGIFLAGIYWIWSVVDVLSANDLKPYQKKFWLIIVIAVPAFGGLLFHLMHQSRNKIVT